MWEIFIFQYSCFNNELFIVQLISVINECLRKILLKIVILRLSIQQIIELLFNDVNQLFDIEKQALQTNFQLFQSKHFSIFTSSYQLLMIVVLNYHFIIDTKTENFSEDIEIFIVQILLTDLRQNWCEIQMSILSNLLLNVVESD